MGSTANDKKPGAVSGCNAGVVTEKKRKGWACQSSRQAHPTWNCEPVAVVSAAPN